MADIKLVKIIFTHVSYDMNVENAKHFSLEVKNQIGLKVPKDENDTSFMMVVNMTAIEPENNIIKINIKANAIFSSDEKITSYDKIFDDICFPLVYKEISDKIDGILEVLEYPKLGIANKESKEK